MSNQVAPEQQAINELNAQATSQEDQAYLAEEQAKLDAERSSILTQHVGEVVIGADGVVVDKATFDKTVSEGHDLSGSYTNGRRS